jgi:hypothetical protein
MFHGHTHACQAPSLSPHLSCRPGVFAALWLHHWLRAEPSVETGVCSRRGCRLYGEQHFTYDASAVTCLVSIAPDRCSLTVLPAGLPCGAQQASPGGHRHIDTCVAGAALGSCPRTHSRCDGVHSYRRSNTMPCTRADVSRDPQNRRHLASTHSRDQDSRSNGS